MNKAKLMNRFLGSALALLGSLALQSSSVAAQTLVKPVQAMLGSAAIVDDANRDKVTLAGKFVGVNSTAPGGTSAVFHYNLGSCEVCGTDPDPIPPHLKLRYRDNGTGSNVIAKLKEYNQETGIERILLTFDSEQWPQSSSYQRQGITGAPTVFDFEKNVYFIEVTLKRFDTTGAPSIGAIQFGIAK